MKILAIGRNYIDHAKELNNPIPSEPMFFMKPDTAIVRNNNPFFYPEFSSEIHYELEVVLKISRVGKNVAEKFAHRYYSEIGLGIDFTARDIQRKCQEKGHPWEIAKSFDHSAPISKFISKDQYEDLKNIKFHLDLNGVTVQKGNTADMIFHFDRLVSHVSKYITLRMGDMIFTGTPAGVGSVKIGDRLQAYLEDKLMLDFFVR